MRLQKVLAILFFAFAFFCPMLAQSSFAKSDIEVDEENCVIKVKVRKEFYVISPEARGRKIEEIDGYINQWQEWINWAAERMVRPGRLPDMDRASSLRKIEDAHKSRDTWRKNKEKLEAAQAADAAMRPGVSDADVRARVNKWAEDFSNVWNEDDRYAYGCCKVKFIYEFNIREEDGPKTDDFDQIGIHLSSDFRSIIRGAGENRDGDGFSNAPYDKVVEGEFCFDPDESDVGPHEAGHEMGLGDKYRDEVQPDGTVKSRPLEGHENDNMARLGGKAVSEGRDGNKVDNIAKILSKRNIVCPESCCEPLALPGGPLIVKVCTDRGPRIMVLDAYGRVYVNAGSTGDPTGLIKGGIAQAKAGSGRPLGEGESTFHDLGREATSIMALDPDITPEQIEDLSNQLGDLLKGGTPCKKLFDPVTNAPGVDFVEWITERVVQQEQQITPNDPFYFDLSVHKPKRGKPQSTPAIFGAPLKIGGESVRRVFYDSKKPPMPDQWGLHAVGFTPRSDPKSAWNLVNADKKNVVVAVIDSGLDTSHIDGPKYLWVNRGETPNNSRDDDGNGYIDDVHGWNFVDENNDLTDHKGHGTLVTGIIAAKTNNAKGIAGINPGAQIMVLKAADENGKSNNLNIYRALCYAVDNGARVINISLGGRGVSELERRGINYAYSKGCTIVVATGNHSADISDYGGPPALKGVITVSALDNQGKRIWFSNVGANVALTAPGEDIYSLYSKDARWPGALSIKEKLCHRATGTSFSAPFVTATASLLLVKNPKLTNQDIEDILLDSATDLESEGWDRFTGAGLLNAYAALSKRQKPILTLRFTDIVVKRKKKKVFAIDLFGVIRGDSVGYTVELAKGKKSDKWKKIFESTVLPAANGFICRIDGAEVKRKGKDWSVRIIAKDRKGNIKKAEMWFSLNK